VSALICTVVKANGKPCGRAIHAWTGLQELNKLGAHIRRCHRNALGFNTLLELRVKMENGEPIYCRDADRGDA
jgi:hypothetical protein